MALISIAWLTLDEGLNIDAVFIVAPFDVLAIHLALGTSIAVFLHAFTKELNVHSRWSRRLTSWFQRELGHLEPVTILILALSSGIGEELLFRGVIQQKVGIWVASFLFAIVHWPPQKELRAWTYMAGIVGLLFGGITILTSSIIPAIVAHILINFLNLRLIVRSR